jgi:uncharacterized lipoprotein YmbA
MMAKLPIFLIVFIGALLNACSVGGNTKTSQFYVLGAIIEQPKSDTLENLRLGVGPIAIPGYVDRPQMVTKTDTAEIRIDEYARWAEPLEEMFTRTLSQNIRALTNSQEIHSHPWPSLVEYDYRIGAKVIKFENDSQGNALLVVHWGLIEQDDQRKLSNITYSEYHAAAKGTDFSSRVDALNDTLAQFARDIVATLD